MSENKMTPAEERRHTRLWLEGVKRYAMKKGYEIQVVAKDLFNSTPYPNRENPMTLEQIKEAAFKDELAKIAALPSEIASILNPLNVIAAPGAAIAAAITKTRTEAEEKEASKAGLSNMLVPGKGVYNYLKRLGRSAADQGSYKPLAAEFASSLNPLNMVAGGVAPLAGGIAALVTKTRTDKEQKDSAKDLWKKILIPGVGAHNLYKRLGHSHAKYDKD